VRAWEGQDKRKGKAFYVELFQWCDDEASGLAHQTPEIMAVWESMGPLLEELTISSLTPLDPNVG
jgi:hypothetical protein